MKTKIFTATIVICLLGLTGCNKERMNDTTPQPGAPVMMTLQTGSPETRADYTEDAGDNTKLNFSWRANDAISVVVDGVTGNCQLTTSSAGKRVPFSGTIDNFTGTKNIYAIYPYNSTAYTITNGGAPANATVALTLPNLQSYTIGGAISNSYLVGTGAATATGTAIEASAAMKQVMSIIKLNITGAPDKVTGVKLKCTDAVFPTTATVKLSDATITNPGNLEDELSMTVTDNNPDHTVIKEISFAMFPANLTNKKIQVSVSFADGKGLTIEKNGIDFKRNEHYKMEVDASTAAIRIGAFYMEDGTIVDKDASLSADQQANCIGIVCYLNSSGTDGKIVSLDEVTETKWSTENIRTGATSDTDGADNTKKVFALSRYITDNNTYPAFAWCAKKNNPAPSGINWYIPAKSELENNIYANKAILNASLALVNEAAQLSDAWYWSSTQNDVDYAWYVYFNIGLLDYNFKNYNLGVRVVSAF